MNEDKIRPYEKIEDDEKEVLDVFQRNETTIRF